MVEFTLRRTLSCTTSPNQIREYRLRAGLTQKQLGKLLGKGRHIISSWERGRTLPSLPNVLRLARALNTLTESLYAGHFARTDADDLLSGEDK